MLKIAMVRCTLIALACSISLTAHAIADDLQRIDIPPGDLAAALQSLARQSNIEIIYQTDQLKGLHTRGVSGPFSAREALRKLLEGTPLLLRTDPTGAILVVAPPPESSPADSKTGEPPPRDQQTTPTSGISVPHLAQLDPGSSVGFAADQAEQPKIEEVLVTARKTEESLQRVPISVSVVSGPDLAARSLDDLAAVGQSTPNFSFSRQAQGGAGAGVVYIRGVGQADTLATFDPAVGVYVDGVYLGRMQGNDLDMMGIERLEILRGPQGTLFGKNTSGGAVNIITQQPDAAAGALSGRLEVIGGNFSRFDIVGGANLPLITDTVALLLSGSRRSEDGYGRRVDGQSTGSTNRDAGRAALLLKLGDHLSAVLSVDALAYNETNAVMKLVDVNTSVGAIAALNAFTSSPYDQRWLSPNDYLSYGTGPNSNRGTLWGTSLTLNLNTDGITLKSISAYRHITAHNDLDPDNSPVTVLDDFDNTLQHQFSQELQASGSGLADRLKWVLGLYYFHEEAIEDLNYNILTPLTPFLGSLGFTQGNIVTNNSEAGYGQGSYSLTDQLRLTAGLRYTHDQKEDQRSHAGYPSGTTLEPTITKSAGSNDVSPRVGLDYQWTPTVMTYVSAAKGYKAGGFNGRAGTVADFNQFGPEKVWTYELGVRSDLFERRVRFNATAFYSDYSALQLQINGSTLVNGTIAPFTIVTNIPKARVTGGEMELAVAPAIGLTLTGGLGLTDARYTELPTDPRFIVANLITRDTKFVNTPEVSFTLGAQYTRPVSDKLQMTGRIDYSHKSTIQYWVTNSPYVRQDPYGLLSARWTLMYEPAQISLSVFGTNLTNQRYIVGGYDDATVPNPGLGFAIADVGRPREYGASLQWHF
jgi:iron complex outermembrane receptor protein